MNSIIIRSQFKGPHIRAQRTVCSDYSPEMSASLKKMMQNKSQRSGMGKQRMLTEMQMVFAPNPLNR